MVKTFLLGGILLIFVASGFWYFFDRDYDYTISFKTSNPTGLVYYELLEYDYATLKVYDQEKISAFRELEQKCELEGSEVSIRWEIAPLNDSVTMVTAQVRNLSSPFVSRLKLLFNSEPAQKKLKEEVILLRQNLNAIAENYRIEILGESISPQTTCACLSLNNTVERKALEMIGSINYLSDFVLFHDLKTDGRPRVHVNSWEPENNRMIDFDFCFPLKEDTVIPEDPFIFKKKIPAQRSLKAIYNGNYIYSHYTWLALLDYAEENGFELKKKPLEIFNNNPEMGGDALRWEAEIFLPLKP